MLCSLFAAAAVCRAQGRARIKLDGDWQFRLDPEGAGETGEWHSAAVPLPRSIRVPGTWQAQGIGERSGILRNHYVGHAWYRRQVAIPADWGGKTVLLRATVFVTAGTHDGFTTPFNLDISGFVRPGSENIIAILVSNPGPAIAEPPDMQKGSEPTGMLNYIGNWGGVYGSVALEAASPARIDEVAIAPDMQRNLASFRIVLRSRETGAARPLRVEVTFGSYTAAAEARIEPGRTTKTEVPLRIPNAVPWSPERPHLYQASVRLLENGREIDRVGERFGMREISIRENVLLLNGKPLYLRGYGDDNVEVLTGTPPASKEVFLERLRLARSFGCFSGRIYPLPQT